MRPPVPPRDTSPDADAAQVAALGRMSAAQRLALALDLSLTARALARAGLRHRHPDWSDVRIERELLRLAFASGEPPPPLR